MNNIPNTPPSPERLAMDKVLALCDNITARIPDGVDSWNRSETLRYISRAEHIIFLVSSFFSGCENHGTLYLDAWGGYQLRDYMLEAGIVNSAEVFLKMYPFEMAIEELETLRQQLDDDESFEDEYLNRLGAIRDEMKKIEREMPSETWEEVFVLLWAYAQKQGLDKLLSSDGNGR